MIGKKSINGVNFDYKIFAVGDNINLKRDKNGAVTMAIRQFLLDEDSLKL